VLHDPTIRLRIRINFNGLDETLIEKASKNGLADQKKSWFAGLLNKRGNWPVTGCGRSRKKAPGE
jgi:hypothetical protein